MSYRLPPLERRGVLLGLRPLPLTVLAVAVLAGVGVLATQHGTAAPVEAFAVVTGAGASVALPVAGRPLVDWVHPALRWTVGARRRVVLGHPVAATAPPGLAVLAAPTGPGDVPLGVVVDRRAGTWAGVIPLRARGFTLLDAEEKTRRLAAWGAVLAAAARPGSPVQRIQWVERTVPTILDAAAAVLPPADVAAGGAGAAALHSYREVLASAAVGDAHEVHLVVVVHPRRAGRAGRAFGAGPAAACALLRRELRLLEGQLRQADADPAPALAPDALVGLAAAAPPRQATRRAHPWPAALVEGWAEVRVDDRWERTFWVEEWPRVDVGPDFLASLFLVGGDRRISLTMAPVPADEALRAVQSARTAELADEELRRRAGFLDSARRRRESEGTARREVELADGHAEYRFCGYVTVGGRDRPALETACAEVEQAAQAAHLTLRVLYGQQREAAAWTLPLGRGLR